MCGRWGWKSVYFSSYARESMKIIILKAAPKHPVDAADDRTAQARGHQVRVLNPRRCLLGGHKKPGLVYQRRSGPRCHHSPDRLVDRQLYGLASIGLRSRSHRPQFRPGHRRALLEAARCLRLASKGASTSLRPSCRGRWGISQAMVEEVGGCRCW